MTIDQRYFFSNVTGFINLPLNGNTTLTLASNIAALEFSESKNFRIVLRADSPSGNIIATSNTFSMYGNAFLTIQAHGGVKTEEGDWIIHAFPQSNTFEISSVSILPEKNTIQYLVVGGGGAPYVSPSLSAPGGSSLGTATAGGGGGGLLTGNISIVNNDVGISNVIIGSAGAGGGGDGGQSTFLNVTALGGGGGKTSTDRYVSFNIVGSGGGTFSEFFPSSAVPGSLGTPGQGFQGGSGISYRETYPAPSGAGFLDLRVGGGGGGAGSTAIPTVFPSATTGFNGGNGKDIPWVPSSYGVAGPAPGRWFAGGGGGAGAQFKGPPTSPGQPITGPYTGTSGAGAGGQGGASQSGIVIIRYPKG
jgi:hypothetical protein